MKAIAAFFALIMGLAPSFASAQIVHDEHYDYPNQFLSTSGGTLYSDFDYATEYSAKLQYPAGATHAFSGLYEMYNVAIPPTMTQVHLNFELSIASSAMLGFVFKGKSALEIAVPSSIPNGTQLSLSMWGYNSSNEQVFGNLLKSTVSNGRVVYTISNLKYPTYGPCGFTLGQ